MADVVQRSDEIARLQKEIARELEKLGEKMGEEAGQENETGMIDLLADVRYRRDVRRERDSTRAYEPSAGAA